MTDPTSKALAMMGAVGTSNGIAVPPPLPAHCTCGSCGFTHRSVEGRGIFHCPNPICPSAGAARWRHKLKSFRELTETEKAESIRERGRAWHHIVDPQEQADQWHDLGSMGPVRDPGGEVDQAYLAAAGRCIDSLVEKYGITDPREESDRV